MAIVKIPVPKAKGEYIEIDTDKIPQDMWNEAVLQGLKQMLGRGMSKISKTTYPKADELAAAAKAKAEENAKAILENDQKKIKLSTDKGKTVKMSGAVNTEAMRLARQVVKDLIKKAGGKISHYKASEITTAAKAVLADPEQGPPIIAKAEAAVADREAMPKGGIDIMSLIKESPELVAKAEAKKAEAQKDKPLSAKQAGQTQKRQKAPPPQKPTAQATQTVQ